MDLAAEWERVRTTPSDIVDHLDYMVGLVLGLNATKVIELGVRHGTSTIAWLYALEQTGGHLWSVDIDPAPDWLQHDRWTFVQGDDRDGMTCNATPTKADVLFVDSSHAYQHTIAELHMYGRRVREGGVIVCHDTELERPYGAPPQDPPFPVAHAVRDYCAGQQFEVEWREGCYGLAVIRVV